MEGVATKIAVVHCDPCGADASFPYPASIPAGTEIKWEHGQSNDDPNLCDLHLRHAADDPEKGIVAGDIVVDADGYGVPAVPFVGIFVVPEATEAVA
jgi:hypothetical protein